MAFYIEYTVVGIPFQAQWNIPRKKHPLTDKATLVSVMADGDEKRLIEVRFTNLPITIGDQPCTWRGEMAQFIYENL